jgi:diguanylate cyclase (GGDEF)-like protein
MIFKEVSFFMASAFITTAGSLFFFLYNIIASPLGKPSRSFAILSFFMFVSSLSIFTLLYTKSFEIAHMMAKIETAGIILLAPSLFNFVNNFLKNKLADLKWYFRMLFFLPSVIIIIVLFITNSFGIAQSTFGFVLNNQSFMYIGPLFLIPLEIVSIVFVFRKIALNKKGQKSNFALIFLVFGMVFYILFASLYQLLLRANIVDTYPITELIHFIQYIFIACSLLIIEYSIRNLTNKKIFENIDDGFMVMDNYGEIIELNKSMDNILFDGEYFLRKENNVKQDIKSVLLSKICDKGKVDIINSVLDGRLFSNFNCDISVKGQLSNLTFNFQISPVLGINKIQLGKVILLKNITTYKNNEELLRYKSFHDELTGLYNRAYFKEELKRLNSERQLPLSIVMGDVNGLKIVNDTFGHLRGDELLIEIALILKICFRSDDIIARWGGDEFIIILPKTPIESALKIIGRINEKCRQDSTGILPLSISMGACTKTKTSEDIGNILQTAEDNMYMAKILSKKDNNEMIISSLEENLGKKDFETDEHVKRITQSIIKVGERLLFPQNKLDELKLLAALHDIGKIAIADRIFLKTKKLNHEEWEIIKKHPEMGYRIAESNSELSVVSESILSHHERWDGEGYPRGLKKEEIPLAARILAIADAFESMTNDRPYRKALEVKQALEELSNCSGTQFDPELVKIFIDIKTAN